MRVVSIVLFLSLNICNFHVICFNNLCNRLGDRLSNLCLNNNDSLPIQYIHKSDDAEANNLKQ